MYQSIKNQLIHKIPDWISKSYILTEIYLYLENALIFFDRLKKTHQELKENFCKIERVKKRLLGIYIKDTCGIVNI